MDPTTSAALGAVLTAVLVAVTAYYAWQNRQMVLEMRATRNAHLRPHLVPTLHPLVAGLCWLRLANVGPGAALKVNVDIALEPGDWRRHWEMPVVTAGEAHDFVPRDTATGSVLRMDTLTERYATLRLTGTCVDATGDIHSIDATIDIREWWEAMKASHHAVNRDWSEESAKSLKEIADSLSAWTQERRYDRANASTTPLERVQWRIEGWRHRVRASADRLRRRGRP
jgi:hypothetical protein